MSPVARITEVPRLPRRQRSGHKGSYGHVLCVGGSRGMSGAAALMTNGALRGGAGLVTFATPETAWATVVPLCPSALSVPLACDASGTLAPQSVRQILTATKFTVLAMGPGMGQGIGQQNLVRAALEQDKPLVLDADGLNNAAAIDGWPALRKCAMVLTPHPGELSRLTGQATQDIQADRETAALNAVRAWTSQSQTDQPLVLVLKGEGTVVTDGRRIYVNNTGNPGMATGGTGDVLTGVLAAFIGQGLSPFDAAVLAVYVHGKAGDLAAADVGEVSMISWDLLEYLPRAIMETVEP